MKIASTLGWRRPALWVCLALLAVAQAPSASAATVLPPAARVFFGSDSNMLQFDASGAGTFVAEVADLSWPTALSALSITAYSTSQTLASWTMTPSTGPQTHTVTFDVGSAGSYWAQITAAAGQNLYDAGAYGFLVNFTPAVVTPLPASDWMLLAGILLLAALSRVRGVFGPLSAVER